MSVGPQFSQVLQIHVHVTKGEIKSCVILNFSYWEKWYLLEFALIGWKITLQIVIFDFAEKEHM